MQLLFVLIKLALSDPMLSLQASLKVQNWVNNYPCSWDGVYCDWDNQVTSICLTNLNFSGNLPENVFSALPKLEYFSASNTLYLDAKLNLPNDICLNNSLMHIEVFNFSLANFPVQVTKCVKLEVLSLTYAQISGPLPDFSGLSGLKIIELDHNMISGNLPDSLAGLQSLEIVHLFNNQLSGSLPVFTSKSLQVLDVRENNLEGIVNEQMFSIESGIYFGFDGNNISVPEVCEEVTFCVYIKNN